MIFGAYLGASTLIFLLVFFKLSLINKNDAQAGIINHQLRSYTFKSFIFILLGLVTFTLLSIWMNLLQFGMTTEFRFPQDYIEAGFIGWLIMAVALSGVFSPIIVGKITRNSKATSEK